MQGMHCQSASQEEWSALMDAIRCVGKDIAVYEHSVASAKEFFSRSDFDFNESPPQFRHVDDANECIQRLWSVCSRLTDQQQLIRDRIEKDSTNSSRPPSTDSIAAKADRYRANHQKHIPTGRQQGAQPGHKGSGRHLKPTSTVDDVIVCSAPEHCEQCQITLVDQKIARRKQVSYLKSKYLTVTEFQVMKARCKSCRRIYCGELPVGTPKGAFGSCVLSVIAMLTGRYRLSKRQVKACLYDLFGLKISVGAISTAEKAVSESLSTVALEVHEALKSSYLAHADETTHYHKHQLRWMWLLSNENLAYISTHRYRNGEMARCLLGDIGQQIWVTDRYGVYGFLPKKQHQYCWSHLKRDIKAIIDHPDEEHAKIGNRLEGVRRAIFDEYHWWQENSPNNPLLAKTKPYLRQFRSILRNGLLLSGEKTAGFCRNLITNWRKLWNFLGNEKIPPTNNHGERVLRHNVLWRKLSLGTQSNRGDRYVERISTVQLSCRLQGRDLLLFLQTALNCFWSGQDPPSLLSNLVNK